MNYLYVEVSASVVRANAESGEPQFRCVDGRMLRPGVCAAIVTEFPAWRAADGQARARGFYAVLWPMGEGAPRYDEGPFCFGPFHSRRMADELIREVSAVGAETSPAYGVETRRIRHREKRPVTQ